MTIADVTIKEFRDAVGEARRGQHEHPEVLEGGGVTSTQIQIPTMGMILDEIMEVGQPRRFAELCEVIPREYPASVARLKFWKSALRAECDRRTRQGRFRKPAPAVYVKTTTELTDVRRVIPRSASVLDRRRALVDRLKEHPRRHSLSELCEILEATRPTIVRDIWELRAQGIPIFSSRGRRGGIWIDETRDPKEEAVAPPIPITKLDRPRLADLAPAVAGDVRVDVVSDGAYFVDGGVVFGEIPRSIWEPIAGRPNRKNQLRMGLNCVLIRTHELTILVDAGLGHVDPGECKELYGHTASKLPTNLRKFGVQPRDVDIVVLSHLHAAHAGGTISIRQTTGALVPTFPNARHVVQRDAWAHAFESGGHARYSFGTRTEDLSILAEKDLVDRISGPVRLAPGVYIRPVGGHSPGHQIVLVNIGASRIAYLADLVPTKHHIMPAVVAAVDHRADQVVDARDWIIPELTSEGYELVFAHGQPEASGFLEERAGRLVIRPTRVTT